MISKSRRINKTVFKSLGRGKIFHSPTISLTVYKKTDQSPSQFSFICSKKVSKSAVKRNLLRRRGYNSIQKILSNIEGTKPYILSSLGRRESEYTFTRSSLAKIRSGFYFVFNFKKDAEVATYKDIEENVRDLLKKI